MTLLADEVTAADAPLPAMAPRPARALSKPRLIRAILTNPIAACDRELFEEPIVARRFFGRPVFVVSEPEGVRRVLLDNVGNYPRMPHFKRALEAGLKSGLFTSDAETWQRHRRLMNPALDPRAIGADMPALVAMMDDTLAAVGAAGREGPIDLAHFLVQWIARGNAHICTDDVEAVLPTIFGMAKFPGPPHPIDFIALPRTLRAWLRRRRVGNEAERHYPALARLIAERRAPDYAGRRDLIWRLANAGAGESGGGLSDAEVRDEILTLGVGSIYTVLRPLTWLFYLLALHPEAEARLHAELDGTIGRRVPSFAEIQKLVYLRNALFETMRLYPSIPVMMRTASAPDMICGRRIPRWSIVIVAPWIVHRHRTLWTEPDRFDPDRFAPEAVSARPRFAYLPFSFGPRVCIGASLAAMQMQIAAAMLAQRFRLRLAPGQAIEPASWITVRPKNGIKFTVEPR